jgi:hypothetical protein
MMDKYILNERLHRLEPTDTKCAYCRKGSVVNIDDCHYVPLFMKKDSTNLLVYRSVKFAKILVGISRCDSCKQVHKKASTKSRLICFGIAFFSIPVLYFIHPVMAFVAFFAFFLIMRNIYKYFENQFAVDADVYTKDDGAEDNELIRDLIISGWSFTQPSP